MVRTWPFGRVVLSAAIKSIPEEIIEAARIDGANEFQVFWRIVVPSIAPTIVVVTTYMRNGRWYPTSTTLPNGQVLTISGGDTAGVLNTLPEVYQPGTDTWRSLTSAVKSIPYYPMGKESG